MATRLLTDGKTTRGCLDREQAHESGAASLGLCPAGLRSRDPGVTLVETDRWTMAEELWAYGEDSLYPTALQLSDDEMVRV